jgi:long-chain acyl-CoA synthetase
LNEATNLGSGLAAMNLTYFANKEFRDLELNFIGIMCKNKIEWMLLDLANIFYGYVMVPIAETSDLLSFEGKLE